MPKIQIIEKACLPSTNAELKRLAQAGAEEGTVLLAHRQTAGYGRHGRSFFSPEGTGLYVSILVRPRFAAEHLPLLTPLAAVALCEAIEALTPVRAEIKWVNDIYIDGGKAAGILCEGGICPDGSPDFVVVGMGVNLLPPEGGFPKEISFARAIATEGNEEVLRKDLCEALLSRFFALYRQMPKTDFMTEYRRRSYLDGKRVLVHNAATDTAKTGEGRPAVALGITEGGSLRVRYENGEEDILHAGEVTLRLN